MRSAGRLKKAECARLRDDLRDLGYGQAEAEPPELFRRRFYPVVEHLRALDPLVTLVVGPRGAGKSELFQAFFTADGRPGRCDPASRPAERDPAPALQVDDVDGGTSGGHRVPR